MIVWLFAVAAPIAAAFAAEKYNWPPSALLVIIGLSVLLVVVAG